VTLCVKIVYFYYTELPRDAAEYTQRLLRQPLLKLLLLGGTEFENIYMLIKTSILLTVYLINSTLLFTNFVNSSPFSILFDNKRKINKLFEYFVFGTKIMQEFFFAVLQLMIFFEISSSLSFSA
jgi:hypothetical protein